MAKYRKLPIEIEAFKLGVDKAPEWFMKEIDVGCVKTVRKKMFDIDSGKEISNAIIEFYIDTLEGKMKVSENDYIIKGINDEIYPCKPEIFEKTYELIKEN